MKLGKVVVMVAAGAAAASGALTLKRRYERIQATGSLDRRVDLSGAPFGPSMQAPQSPPVGDAYVLGPPWEPNTLTRLASWVPSAPTTPAARALAYAWASPITLVGALLGFASGSRPEVREGTLVFAHATGLAGVFLRARGFQAVTLGHAIIARSDVDERLMAHEAVHVRHAERLGIFSALLYGALYPIYGYTRHPMERAARGPGGASRR